MAENPSPSSQTLNFENNVKINALTFVVAAIFLFLTIIFFFLLYYYAKHHWRSRSSRTIFAAQNLPIRSLGLDRAILRAIPITLFKPSEFNKGIECAVCLSELAAGEEVRFLPKCSHGFHLGCIDTWFHSHSTCPICRCAVGSEGGEDDESSGLPANVSERNLMISIPIRSSEGVIESGRSRVEEIKSPVTPKMWSLRRILSMGKKTEDSCSSSPRNVGDIEQGLAGSVAGNGEGSSTNFSAANSL